MLFLLTLLFFAKPLLHGSITAPVDNLGWVYPWSESPEFAQAHRDGLQNPLLSDQITLILPAFHYAREEIRNGRLPLWTSAEMGGAPFLANNQSAALYPLALIAYLLPFGVGIQFLIILKPFIAGFGMYLFLCAIGLRRPAAFVGAVAFMFSDYIVVWLGWNVSTVAIWLPWLFLCVEQIYQGSSRREGWIAGLGLISGVHLLAGHIETSFHLFFFSGLYALYRAVVLAWNTQKPQRLSFATRRLAMAVGGLALGLALGAIQLLPTVHYVMQSYIYLSRGSASTQRVLSIKDLATWLVPNIGGNPAYYIYNLGNWPAYNYNERVGYVGIATLVLAALAFVRPRRLLRPYLGAFSILFLFAAALVYGIEPIFHIVRLPLLHTIEHTRLLLVMAFCLAALAAIGFDGLIERSKPDAPWPWARWRTRPVILGAIALTLAGGVALWATLATKRETISTIRWLGRTAKPVSPHLWVVCWSAFALCLLIGSVAFIALLQKKVFDPWLGLGAVVLLLVGDLFLFGTNYNPQTSPRLLYPATPLTDELQSLGADARVATPFVPPNTLQVFDVRGIMAYDGTILVRAYRLIDSVDRWGGNASQPTQLVLNIVPDYNLLAIANITHILLPTADVEPPGIDGHLVLQREFPNDTPLPIDADSEETQKFVAPSDDLSAIAFAVGSSPKSAAKALDFRLTDGESGKVVVQRSLDTAGIAADSWLYVSFPPVQGSMGHPYAASLRAVSSGATAKPFTLYGNTDATPSEVGRLRNGQPMPGTLRYRLYRSVKTDGLMPIWQGGSETLYALDHARPRAYVADGVRAVPDGDAALTALDQLHIPGGDAVVETREPIVSRGGHATIVRDEPGDIVVHVEAPEAGFLVLSEGYGDGGWSVQIDGKAATDMRANFLYQGVAIPQGNHSIHFQYLPRVFIAGASISAGAGLIVLALLGWSLWACVVRRFLSPPSPHPLQQ